MDQRTLCYLGPSLDRTTAKSIVPEAIFLPPARHADLISHVYQYEPTHILLIDGEFDHCLPVWHKECVFCALKGVRIYGASSMGALRAAELADVGVMIGCGKIFHWYWEGLCEADDEVCLLYHQTPAGEYVSDSCPLVNIRAGLLEQVRSGLMTRQKAEDELRKQQALHYTVRQHPGYEINQKRLDAIELLSTFENLEYQSTIRPDITWVTRILNAAIERERRVEFQNAILTLQHIDSYISLHSSEHNQIFWDSKNRSLALILCDLLNVQVEPEEMEAEWTAFCARQRLASWQSLREWLKANAMTEAEFTVMTIQNARIHKIHRAYASTKNWSRQTQTILDYLRTHDQLKLWVEDCADAERFVVDKANEESLAVDFRVPMEKLLAEHFEATGLEISGTLERYLTDSGIGGTDELRVCLERASLSRHGRS